MSEKEKKQSAFSLIETAIVLAVVGLIIGGIWIAAAAVYRNLTQTETQKEVGVLLTQVKRDYRGVMLKAGNYVDLSDYIRASTMASNQNYKIGLYRYEAGASATLQGIVTLNLAFDANHIMAQCLGAAAAIKKAFTNCTSISYISIRNTDLVNDTASVSGDMLPFYCNDVVESCRLLETVSIEEGYTAWGYSKEIMVQFLP